MSAAVCIPQRPPQGRLRKCQKRSGYTSRADHRTILIESVQQILIARRAGLISVSKLAAPGSVSVFSRWAATSSWTTFWIVAPGAADVKVGVVILFGMVRLYDRMTHEVPLSGPCPESSTFLNTRAFHYWQDWLQTCWSRCHGQHGGRRKRGRLAILHLTGTTLVWWGLGPAVAPTLFCCDFQDFGRGATRRCWMTQCPCRVGHNIRALVPHFLDGYNPPRRTSPRVMTRRFSIFLLILSSMILCWPACPHCVVVVSPFPFSVLRFCR